MKEVIEMHYYFYIAIALVVIVMGGACLFVDDINRFLADKFPEDADKS